MDTDIRMWELKKKKKKTGLNLAQILPTYMKSSFWLVLLYFN